MNRDGWTRAAIHTHYFSGCRFTLKKDQASKSPVFPFIKKTAVRLFLSRGRDQPERVRHVPFLLPEPNNFS